MENDFTELPFLIENDRCYFRLDAVTDSGMSGFYVDKRSGHSRLEYAAEFLDGSRVSFSFLTNVEAEEISAESNSFHVTFDSLPANIAFHFHQHDEDDFSISLQSDDISSSSIGRPESMILFDISDLVYYIGHHDHLTGIQRVQACVLLGLISSSPDTVRGYISFNNRTNDFEILEQEFFEALLTDLSRPVAQRQVPFDRMDARLGVLPRSKPLRPFLEERSDVHTMVYLLGAAWVNKDYFHRIADLKRRHGAKFCMTVHDLIPIYARDTCDQGTAIVFEEFLRKAIHFTDQFFTVSEYTAYDLLRFAKTIGRDKLSVSVIENAHTFDEFFPSEETSSAPTKDRRYALFVSTIEGRKNHSYIFDVWAALAKRLRDLPTLICVGRLGWRAEAFLEKMLTSNDLGGKIKILSDISDAELNGLYKGAMFTVYPSVYEGWGLPVGESLAKGKLCVSSDRSSIPEVSREFGYYVDISSVRDGTAKIQKLIEEDSFRLELESRLQNDFRPRTWKDVAGDLVRLVSPLALHRTSKFPILQSRREYKTAQLPPRTYDSLGQSMVAKVEGARRSFLTRRINDDFDLISAQAMRLGSAWCAPEEWGTWAKFPKAERLFYIKPPLGAGELVLYEKLRVIGPCVGGVLKVVVNSGPASHYFLSGENVVIRISDISIDPADELFAVHCSYELLSSDAELIKKLRQIDGRLLGIGFESFLVSDDGDFQTRVRILEHLTFGGEFGGLFAPSLTAQQAKDAMSGAIAIHSPWDVRAAMRLLERNARTIGRSPPKIQLDEVIQFVSGKASDRSTALIRGWSVPERDGVWTDGVSGELRFTFASEGTKLLALVSSIKCLADPAQPIEVAILHNGNRIASISLNNSDFHEISGVVPVAEIPDQRTLDLTFVSSAWRSPDVSEANVIPRRLGLKLSSLLFHSVPWLTFGTLYSVGDQAESQSVFLSGWYHPERGGIWSGLADGRMLCGFEDGDLQSVVIEIEARVFGTAYTGRAFVDVLIQGYVATTLAFDSDEMMTKSFAVSLARSQESAIMDLKLVRRNAVSPAQAGFGSDERVLGLFISNFKVSKYAEVTARSHDTLEDAEG